MYAFIAWVAFLWFFIMFLDTVFKTCMFYPYCKMLQMNGVHVKPLIITLQITRFNRFINRMGHWRSTTLKKWFNAGVIVACVLAIPCLIVFLVSSYHMITYTTIQDYDNAVLVPVIPGYNFPSSHWLHYFVILLFCSIFHEFGHALAASREGISVADFGLQLYAVVPLAFVNVRYDQFRQISRLQQLRILCAGIWHNVILVGLAILFCLSLNPLYNIGKGVTVLGIHQQSGLNHPAGFEIGNHIYGIGDCNINFIEDWRKCLKQISEKPQQGLCIPGDEASKTIEKCVNSSVYLHFQASKVAMHDGKDICLHAREAVQNFSVCSQNSDCIVPSSCMFPILSSKVHRFVTIKRHHKTPVLYVGAMDELYSDVKVSRFAQKYKLFSTYFAEAIITFMEYIIMFSAGLACMNMLPILSLDGEFITEILFHICLERYIQRHDVRANIFMYISKFITCLCIFLIFINAYKFYVVFNT